MMEKVGVDTPSGRYHVTIGDAVLGRVGQILAPLVPGSHIAMITDEHVDALFGDAVMEAIEMPGFHASKIVVPAGEPSKSWEMAGSVLDQLAACGLDRTDGVVALGGGVVGDLAGFCASVFLRGIAFAQVPTTLLAQVDSSIGGKTAVDLAAGKNLAGVVRQPVAVISDTSVLDSLPESEWSSGLGEVAKSAVLDSAEFLGWLERDARALVTRDPAAVAEAVRLSVRFKARVVSADEHESGAREQLNLGHTLGHAIEKVAGYGVVPHGVAVAEGMRFAARLAERVGAAPSSFHERQQALLDALGLLTLRGAFDADAIRLAMSSDKKARGGTPRFVLATTPGQVVVQSVDETVLADELRAWARERGG